MSNRVANGAAIRAIRQVRGMSLRELATATGHNRGHISRVERGAIGSEAFAHNVSVALGCSFEAVTVAAAARDAARLPYVETGPTVIAQ